MGAYLDTPVKDKNPEHGSTSIMDFGLCSMQGWRCDQEDDHLAVIVKQPKDGADGMLLAVWDGHGGKNVALYAKQEFQKVFER